MTVSRAQSFRVPRVGIALGAGGARGFAHIGVLEAVADAGIPIDALAGCSVGAVVGSMWALGFAPDAIEHLLAATDRHAMRLAFPFWSLFRSTGIGMHIRQTAAGRSFEDTRIPFAVVATDIHTGEEVVIRDGVLWKAILASTSIPGVYPPVRIDDRWLVDGGVVCPVPVSAVATLGADVVVGVKLQTAKSRAGSSHRTPSIFANAFRAAELMQDRLADASAARAEIVIEPVCRSEGSGLGLRFARSRGLRRAGRAAAEAVIPRLRSILARAGERKAAP